MKITLKYLLINKWTKRQRKRIVLWDESPVSEKKTGYKIIKYLKIKDIKIVKDKQHPNK